MCLAVEAVEFCKEAGEAADKVKAALEKTRASLATQRVERDKFLTSKSARDVLAERGGSGFFKNLREKATEKATQQTAEAK